MQILAEFVTSAAGTGDFPRDPLPEVALVGRSNVGKSSLINALARRQVARTSAAPGKTRLANFYRVKRGPAPAVYLVDLPGYGYARGGDPAAREFNRLVDAYFARAGAPSGGRHPASGAGGRAGGGRIAPADAGAGGRGGQDEPAVQGIGSRDGAGPRKEIAVLLLIDSRHPGLESDLDAWAWLADQPFPRGIVGTKVDKLTRADRVRHARQLESLFDVPVLLVSAQTGEGLEDLWKLIAKLPSRTVA